MLIRTFSATLFVFLSLISTSTNVAAVPTPEWHVEFGGTATPAVYRDGGPRLSANASGSWIAHFSLGFPQTMVARLDALGIAQWTVSPPSYSSSLPAGKILFLRDGSMAVLTDQLSLYTADGGFIWTSALPSTNGRTSQIMEIGSELVLVVESLSGGTNAFRIDRFSGLVLEISPAMIDFYNCGASAMTDGGAAYLVSACGTLAISKIRINPLRSEWRITLPETIGYSTGSVAADSTGLYIAIASTVYKFAQEDGTTSWSTNGTEGTASAVTLDADGDPLVYGAQSIRKLDRNNGAVRWSRSATGPISSVAVSADGIFVLGIGSAVPSASGSGYLERRRASDGQMIWQIPLTTSALGVLAVNDVVVHADRILASGAACPVNYYASDCTPLFWSTTIAGGSAIERSPAFPIGSIGNARLASGDTTLAAAVESDSEGRRVRIKRISNSDGTALWSSVHALPDSAWSYVDEWSAVLHGGGEGAIIVAYRQFNPSNGPSGSSALILKIDEQTGEQLWRKSLLDRDSGYTDIHAVINTDEEGNVYASVHEKTIADYSVLNWRRQIRKYASASGKDVARIDLYPIEGRTWFPANLQVVGNDILLDEAIPSSAELGLKRVDLQTGQVLWTNPAYYLNYLTRFSANSACHYRKTLNAGVAGLTLGCIDLENGNSRWTKQFTYPGVETVLGPVLMETHEGDLFVKIGYRFPIRPTSRPSEYVAQRFNAQTGDLIWTKDLGALIDGIGPILGLPQHQLAGIDALYSSQEIRHRNDVRGSILTGISLKDGSPVGSQFFTNGSQSGAASHQAPLGLLGFSENEGLIFSSFHMAIGSSPQQFRVEKRQPPQRFAGGSLRVELAANATPLGDGMSSVTFVFETINDGTIVAPSVAAVLDMHSESIRSEVSCDISGRPCQAINTPRTVELTTDLASGERLRLSGTFTLREDRTSELWARAFSPYGFVEMDMRDNVKSRSYGDYLFRAGFDG